MIDRGGIATRIGVGVGCLLGTGIIALFLLWILTVVLSALGVVV